MLVYLKTIEFVGKKLFRDEKFKKKDSVSHQPKSLRPHLQYHRRPLGVADPLLKTSDLQYSSVLID